MNAIASTQLDGQNANKEVQPTDTVKTTNLRREDIALKAYTRFVEEGCPQGRELEHWISAESELAMASNRVLSALQRCP